MRRNWGGLLGIRDHALLFGIDGIDQYELPCATGEYAKGL